MIRNTSLSLRKALFSLTIAFAPAIAAAQKLSLEQELQAEVALMQEQLPFDVGFGLLDLVELREGNVLYYRLTFDPDAPMLKDADVTQMRAGIQMAGAEMVAPMFCTQDEMLGLLEQGATFEFGYYFGPEPLTTLSMDASVCAEWAGEKVTWEEVSFSEAQRSAKQEMEGLQDLLPMQMTPGLEWTGADVDGDTIFYSYRVDLENPSMEAESEDVFFEEVLGSGRDQAAASVCSISASRSLLEAGMIMNMSYTTNEGSTRSFQIGAEDC